MGCDVYAISLHTLHSLRDVMYIKVVVLDDEQLVVLDAELEVEQAKNYVQLASALRGWVRDD